VEGRRLATIYSARHPIGQRSSGRSGRLTADVLRRHAPADLRRWQFFLCGAGPPVDAGTAALVDIGVPPEYVHAERFVEV
jgi:ferredoxin-NADP reductase